MWPQSKCCDEAHRHRSGLSHLSDSTFCTTRPRIISSGASNRHDNSTLLFLAGQILARGRRSKSQPSLIILLLRVPTLVPLVAPTAISCTRNELGVESVSSVVDIVRCCLLCYRYCYNKVNVKTRHKINLKNKVIFYRCRAGRLPYNFVCFICSIKHKRLAQWLIS